LVNLLFALEKRAKNKLKAQHLWAANLQPMHRERVLIRRTDIKMDTECDKNLVHLPQVIYFKS